MEWWLIKVKTSLSLGGLPSETKAFLKESFYPVLYDAVLAFILYYAKKNTTALYSKTSDREIAWDRIKIPMKLV